MAIMVKDPYSETLLPTMFRFPRHLFQQLVELYGADLETRPPVGLRTLPNRFLDPGRVIAIALHRLATGGSDVVVGTIFGVSGATVHRATQRFVNAVLDSTRGPKITWPNEIDRIKIKREFQMIAGFPNCTGAIDCTHIQMECPPNANAIEWRDRTQRFSMVLQAIVSPDMKILDVCTGWPGSVHDQRIFYRSSFHQNIKNRLSGPDLEVNANGVSFTIPENIIGDAGYMQKINVMTPYSFQDYNRPIVASYNDAHSATRKCVECAFGRLKNQWHYLDSNLFTSKYLPFPFITLCC